MVYRLLVLMILSILELLIGLPLHPFLLLEYARMMLDYGVNLRDGEKGTVVGGLWRRNCGLFAEHVDYFIASGRF